MGRCHNIHRGDGQGQREKTKTKMGMRGARHPRTMGNHKGCNIHVIGYWKEKGGKNRNNI